MKRAVISGPAEGRCLKRANSSLFSIATLVDDDPNPETETIARLIEGGKSSNNLLLVDTAAAKEDTDISTTYSTLKVSGLVPLDCSSDHNAEPDDAVSSSCSSSELDEQEDNNKVVCKSIHDEKELTDNALTKHADGQRRSCDPQVLLGTSLPDIISEETNQALPTSSSGMAASSQCLPCEPSTTGKVECKKEIQATQSYDNRTGLIFESGTKHFDRHNRFHKERPLRITAVHDYLANAKPADDEKTIFERCRLMEGRGGEDDVTAKLWLDDHDYLRVHLPGYMQRLDRISTCNCHNRLDTEAEQFKSIYFTNDSVREAKAAASSLCNLVSRVASGDLDNGFAVIRPPGHHAEPGMASGYCVINNVAVAAAYAQEKLGMKRILIVDWDVHHGNGTQRCFIDSPNILYFSAHRYHGGNFFPFLQHGGPTTIGNGAGEGFNINVGWNEKNMGDDEYLVVWEKLLMPVAAEFNPDLVLVSAGFDAAQGDMGECDLSPECFARLTRQLKTLANGKVVCALEGGYIRSVLCKCIESVLGSLLDAKSNDKCKKESQAFYKNLGDNNMLDCVRPSAAKSIRDTMRRHSKYWNCLKTESQGSAV
mmetsp:Transcript_5366/g.12190  ORF Transcript_5366/g.12190 Transcript_5366/m.12190 type:complete len:596 (-) Transcript_5366:175-1962(-)|eukprot:CAMPEP_0172315036 /NCGR_PEP_ID=MMETSP1058-20130122/23930_1 /TAXON_ID=83371 /ORGANISM="Detonula confervacea, Strain CCMP 353" /LENGTH=595 /DNA_ID=CAMNT_0013029023 /DNA_START=18 /DNA_END=1805 /DNA_ORIENTATION=+